MKKVWIYQRKDRKGYYVAWREFGKQKSKLLPTKRLAEHFRHIKYQQLNTDVFISPIRLSWPEVKKEFLQRYDIIGLTGSTKDEAKRFLDRFEKIVMPRSSTTITQQSVDLYFLERQSQNLSPYTIKKDIGRLKTLIGWMKEKQYNFGNITFPKIRTPKLQYKALTTKQIRWLFSRCPTPAWRCRILLSLITGLRKTDVDNLNRSSIDLKAAKIDTVSKKTQKVYVNRPLPVSAIPELRSYLKSLPEKQPKLFADVNVRKAWEKLREDSGITRQDLRITFSTIIQRIGSIGSAKNLLEHYSEKTTTEFYTDQELILRWKVNQLPVREWLNRL